MQEKITVAIIGGGAAGLFLASSFSRGISVAIFEREERVGRKLSATGNGQGNVSNVYCSPTSYFTSDDPYGVREKILQAYPYHTLAAHLERLGLFLLSDERGRVYPASRQASAITDALRFYNAEKGVQVYVNNKIVQIDKTKDGFLLTAQTPEGERVFRAENVVLCTGGKAAKNFGTDGNGYTLAQAFGHTVTPLFPSLVQLKTDTLHIKTLKGIRAADVLLTAVWTQNGEKKTHALQGDIIFTDYGVSGDAVFRISAFIVDKIAAGVRLYIDFLPSFGEDKIYDALQRKRENFPALAHGELLCGMVNNQIARAVMKASGREDLRAAASLVKAFPLDVQGSLGFDYAQVTKGGVPLCETDENLQSKRVPGLYFAGEILDVDGQCGGFNLQWAYASAFAVAKAIAAKHTKGRGQV